MGCFRLKKLVNNGICISWMIKNDEQTGWQRYTLPYTYSNANYAILTWMLYVGEKENCVPQICDMSIRPKTPSSLYIAQDTSNTPTHGIPIVFIGY